MPSLINNPDNVVDIAANYQKFVDAQSDVGRELIISATKAGGLGHDDLLAVYAQLTLADGDGSGNDTDGPDAFTLSSIGVDPNNDEKFAAESTETVFFKAQGTGTPKLADVSGVSLAIVAEFKPAR
jgi:hypothetical protein